MKNSTKYQISEALDLENSYRLADIVKQRVKTLAAIELGAGERVLDIGCGVGFLTHEMAMRVGKSGKVIGLDKNPEMINHARRRCEGLQQTKFYKGDAGVLPVDDKTLDAVTCTQVLLYVKDVNQVFAEMRRILKPEGRIVIVETDWRGVVLNSADDSLTNKIFSTWDTSVPSPNLPVHLKPLLQKHEFLEIKVEPIPILNTEYSPSNFSHGMLNWISKNAENKGAINKEQRANWLEDLQKRGQSDSFFFCVNRFLFTAKKNLNS